MSRNKKTHTGAHPRATDRTRPSSRRRCLLALGWAATATLAGFALAASGLSPSSAPLRDAPSTLPAGSGPRSLHELLALPDDLFEKLDIVELNLAVAREIPECRDLDVARYQRTVDEWAAWVKHEIDRHMYRFEQDPGNYKNSRAYFCASMMSTVIGQDYRVHYDLLDFSFEQPEDQFIHGIIDLRKGTCVSLPLIYIAIGQRLGYPIRAVTTPGHVFCRWDDPETGERLNIEAANQGGLTDHPDEYYRHWPYEVDPRWEHEHHILKSLTMRQHASVMVGSLGAYYVEKQDFPAAIRWDGLACWLDPANRSEFVSLCMTIDHISPRYFNADELSGRKKYWKLTPNPSFTRDEALIDDAVKRYLDKRG